MLLEIIASAAGGFNRLVVGYYGLVNGLYTLMVFAAVAVLCGYFRKSAWRVDASSFPVRALPPVSLILPVCNEKNTAVAAVRALLDLEYADYEIIVINDGSTDDTLGALVGEFGLAPVDRTYHRVLSTAGEIRRFYAGERYPGLTVVDKRHSGRADCLNIGLNVSNSPYIVPLTSDVRLRKDALSLLIRPILEDSDRAQSSFGAVQIGASGWLSGFQGVEQARSLVWDQMAFRAIRSLWLTSHAVGVFSKRAVRRLNGFLGQAADPESELALRLHRSMGGRKRSYCCWLVPEPVADRAGAQNLRQAALTTQRRHGGLLQALGTHCGLLLNSNYGFLGMLALPFYWLVGAAGPALEIGGYLSVGLAAALGKITAPFLALFLFLALVYGAFLSLGVVLLSAAARREPLATGDLARRLGYAVLENFGYRQLRAWWQLRAVLRSLSGRGGRGQWEAAEVRPDALSAARSSLVWLSFAMMTLGLSAFVYLGMEIYRGEEGGGLYAQVLTQDSPADGRPDSQVGAMGGKRSDLDSARALAEKGELQESLRLYERLLVKDPEDRQLRAEFAWVLMKAKRFEQAASVYEELLEEDPDSVGLRVKRAMALYGMGDFQGAARTYREILRLDPSNAEARIALKDLQTLTPNPVHMIIGIVLLTGLLLVLSSLLVFAYVLRKVRSSASPSSQEIARHREERYVHWVAAVALLVASYYIVWRLLSTMNWSAWWFSVPLYLAELYGVLSAFMFFFMVWRPTRRVPLPPMPDRTVDVFITTYNEDPLLLRKTILGCLAMTYPHRTYVLDDGNRPEVARLAEELGCEYIAREQNINAKAGNLNNALKRTVGEFIVTLDADHVPLPNFIDRLLGYFRDEKVAFVQTPQDFYNMDSFQHRVDERRRNAWSEQSLFYSVIQPGKDYWNSAFYCGTCAMLRRSALDVVGGFAEGTVTEDIHTSLLLHAKGFKSVYHNESLAYGLAAETALPFHVQRLRWGQGAMQVLVRANPLWIKGLTLPQRISYLASMTTYFDGLQKAVFYAAPVVFFLTGILPIKAFDMVFLLTFVPYLVLFLLSFELMSRGHGSTLMTEQYNMTKFATFIKSVLGLFRKKRLGFRITPKRWKGQADFGVLYPQLLMFSLNLSAIGVGTVRYFWRGDLEVLAFWGNLLWALVNVGLAAAVIRFGRRKIQHRSAYRFVMQLPCFFHNDPQSVKVGVVRDCHEGGAFLLSLEPIPEGSPLKLSMKMGERMVSAEGTVVSSVQDAPSEQTLFRQNVRFTEMAREDQDYLVKYGFEFAVPRVKHGFGTARTVFRELEDFMRPEQRRHKRQYLALPVRLRAESPEPLEVLGVTEDIGREGFSVTCAEDLSSFEGVGFSIFLVGRQINGWGRIRRGEPLAYGNFKLHRAVVLFEEGPEAAN